MRNIIKLGTSILVNKGVGDMVATLASKVDTPTKYSRLGNKAASYTISGMTTMILIGYTGKKIDKIFDFLDKFKIKDGKKFVSLSPETIKQMKEMGIYETISQEFEIVEDVTNNQQG